MVLKYFQKLHNLQIRSYSSRKVGKWKWPQGHKTNIKIYNRLANETTDLVTSTEGTCKWYCCGPTVYDSPHLGHACCYMQFDIIRRILQDFNGLNVIMLMSITDIDDKIIEKSTKTGASFEQVALQYENEFFESLSKLNILEPSLALRVSQHVPDIIQFIDKIVENGHAYVAKDKSVYFDVGKFPSYGKLSPAQESQASVNKRASLDFALWKAAKAGEPSWDSPWGAGRPGWHIECSAMASKYFGSCIDIHSGGIDLLFPHHENEEAQSCSFHRCDQWVNYWIHSGHLHLRDDVKMSKSLKNTVSIDSFLERYSPDHLRTLVTMVPYRNGIEYSEEVMGNAVSVHSRVGNFLNECEMFTKGVLPKAPIDDGLLLKELLRVQETTRQNLSNDFNSAAALSEVMGLISKTSTEISSKKPSEQHSTSFSVLAVSTFVKTFFGKLGFFSEDKSTSQSLEVERILQSSLDLRTKVRDVALSSPPLDKKHKTALLSACDVFRNNLNAVGIEIKDRPNVSTWNVASKRISS